MWIFTEGDGIESSQPFKVFSTLTSGFIWQKPEKIVKSPFKKGWLYRLRFYSLVVTCNAARLSFRKFFQCFGFPNFLWSTPAKNNNHFLVRSHCVIMYSACTSASCLQAAMHMHFTHCKFDNFSFTSFSCHFSCSDKLRRWVSGLCTFLREIATFSSILSHLTCLFLFWFRKWPRLFLQKNKNSDL